MVSRAAVSSAAVDSSDATTDEAFVLLTTADTGGKFFRRFFEVDARLLLGSASAFAIERPPFRDRLIGGPLARCL